MKWRVRDVGVLLTRVKCHSTVVGHHFTAVKRCGTFVETGFTRSTWDCAHVVHNCTGMRPQERPETLPENSLRHIGAQWHRQLCFSSSTHPRVYRKVERPPTHSKQPHVSLGDLLRVIQRLSGLNG